MELQRPLTETGVNNNTNGNLESTPAQDSRDKNQPADEKKQKPEDELNEVHAVGVVDDGTSFYCAVARGDKTLAIYKLSKAHNPEEARPHIVYTTQKRLSCINFTRFPSHNGGDDGFPMVLAGDLAGDAHAYGLIEKRRRLLLGHTASMLTGICVTKDKLLTGDRDEKIRISCFPDTVFIDGFLLGHEAYITSVESTNDDLAITSSGDRSVRLWNLSDHSQEGIQTFEPTELIPMDLSINSDGTLVAVIFDQSNRLDLFEIVKGDDGKRMLSQVATHSCPANPLGVVFDGEGALFLIMKGAEYIQSYTVEDKKFTENKIKALDKLRATAAEQEIVTPESILERDQYGQIKLKKLHETRGPSAGDEPWNRVERVDIAKAANKRHKARSKRRKREDQKASS